jgi:NAD(P) transhydrogenase subunit alpha
LTSAHLFTKTKDMKIAVLRETKAGEKRVALTPTVAQQFIKQGYSCLVETQAGYQSNFSDEAYTQAGLLIQKKMAHQWT